jgi:hypothetical protein
MADFFTIKLKSDHHWSKNVTFELDVITHPQGEKKIVEIRYETDGMKTSCNFINFVEHCTTFFKFFGVPECIQHSGHETILEIINMLMLVPIPETTCYWLSTCGCNMGYCGACVGYQKHVLQTVGDFLILVGFPSQHDPEYEYTHPDSVLLDIEPLTNAVDVYRSCYDKPIDRIESQENIYTLSYGR